MLNDLKKLGFTPNEIKVYSALLDLGQSSTGPIIKRTELHRNIVYDVLDSLVKRNLLLETIKSKKKFFKIRDPQILTDIAHEQLNSTIKIVSEIKKQLHTTAPEVIVYEGKEGWETAYRLLNSRLKPKDEVFAFGVGGDKWVQAMGNYFLEWEKDLIKRGILYRMIGYESQRKEIVAHQTSPIRKTRYLQENSSIFANMEVFKDGIFIQIYTDSLVLIEVRSLELAKSYQQYFNTMWKLAKD